LNEDLTAERWLRIKALFAAAVEAPTAERSELLVREAQGDSGLIAEVQSLLAAHDVPGEFLDRRPSSKRKPLRSPTTGASASASAPIA
jgi:hypothetical protein